MEQNTLIDLIEQNLSQRQISQRLGVSQSTIKYWLKKYNLKTNSLIHNRKTNDLGQKLCSQCESLKPIDDFYKKGEGYHHSYCKKCSSIYFTDRIRSVKIKMIEYKGNKCVNCQLHINETHPSVFDFHHLDPQSKDPKFNRIKFKSWDKIQKELDGCILVCSNCHRIIHSQNELF